MFELELLVVGFLNDGSGCFCPPSFFLSLFLLESPMKLLVLSEALVYTKLFIFGSFLIAPTSPDTICCTMLSNTACESGFLISILNDCARWLRLIFTFRFISFLKTLSVCLNLKLSKNYWMRSMQYEAECRIKYSLDIFLALTVGGVRIESRF